MNTRTVTQVEVWFLFLNPMVGRMEERSLVATALSKESMIEWYNQQVAPELWHDGRYNKTFIQGSRLEWYNPVSWMGGGFEPNDYGQGLFSEWVNEDIVHTMPMI